MSAQCSLTDIYSYGIKGNDGCCGEIGDLTSSLKKCKQQNP